MMVSPAILVMMTTLAQAAPPPLMTPANAKASAQILLRDGTALFERGEMADALKKFQQAYEIFPSPKILFNVGAAQRVLDHPVEALSAFQRFLAEAPDAPAGARQEAQQAVAALTSSLGRVIVECPEAGVVAAIDGTPVGVTPLAAPIWAVPGQHRIGGRHEGMIADVQDVTVSAGTDSAVTLAVRAPVAPAPIVTPSLPAAPLIAEAPAAPPLIAPVKAQPHEPAPPPVAPAERSLTARWWFWAAIGAAVAGGVAGVVLATRAGGAGVTGTPQGSQGIPSTHAGWSRPA